MMDIRNHEIGWSCVANLRMRSLMLRWYRYSLRQLGRTMAPVMDLNQAMSSQHSPGSIKEVSAYTQGAYAGAARLGKVE